MSLEYLVEEEDFDKLLQNKRQEQILDVLQEYSDAESDDFSKLLEDKRHKEIVNVLKEILLSLSADNTSINVDISSIIKEISNLKAELPGSIVNLGKLIENKLDELTTLSKKEDYNWEFIIHRDNKGYITKVDANKTK